MLPQPRTRSYRGNVLRTRWQVAVRVLLFSEISVPKHLPSLLTHLYIKSNVTFSTQVRLRL